MLLGGGSAAVNQTVASLTTSGTGSAANAVVGGFTSNSTLTVNNSAADVFNGTLGGTGTNNNNLALIKNGAGNLTLPGTTNTYTGATTINAGTLTLSGGASLGGTAVTIGTGTTGGGAVLQVSGNTTIGTAGTGSLTINAGTAPSTLSMMDSTINKLNINNTTSGATVLTLGGASGVLTVNMEVGTTADEIALGSGLKGSVGAGERHGQHHRAWFAITGLSNNVVLISAPGGGLPTSGGFTLGAITGTAAGYRLTLQSIARPCR